MNKCKKARTIANYHLIDTQDQVLDIVNGYHDRIHPPIMRPAQIISRKISLQTHFMLEEASYFICHGLKL